MASFKIYSFPSPLLTSYSAFDRETLEGTTPNPLTSVGFMHQQVQPFLLKLHKLQADVYLIV